MRSFFSKRYYLNNVFMNHRTQKSKLNMNCDTQLLLRSSNTRCKFYRRQYKTSELQIPVGRWMSPVNVRRHRRLQITVITTAALSVTHGVTPRKWAVTDPLQTAAAPRGRVTPRGVDDTGAGSSSRGRCQSAAPDCWVSAAAGRGGEGVQRQAAQGAAAVGSCAGGGGGGLVSGEMMVEP